MSDQVPEENKGQVKKTVDPSIASDDLKIEYLPNDEGVKVDGKWYFSLANYFEKREEALKEKAES